MKKKSLPVENDDESPNNSNSNSNKQEQQQQQQQIIPLQNLNDANQQKKSMIEEGFYY